MKIYTIEKNKPIKVSKNINDSYQSESEWEMKFSDDELVGINSDHYIFQFSSDEVLWVKKSDTLVETWNN